MKLKYLILLVILANANAGNMDVCINIVNNFNKQKIFNLFNEKVDIKVGSVNRAFFGAPGCSVNVLIKFSNSDVYTDLGSVIIYRDIGDNYTFFKNTEQKFVRKEGASHWGNILPYVKEGFVDTTDSNSQIFHAYLKNNDYVIFIYNIKNNDKKHLGDGLGTDFINFINVVSEQIIH